MFKKILIGLTCTVAASVLALPAYSKNFCVYVSCRYEWGTFLKNAQGNAIVRTAEFAASNELSGAYYLNNSIFNELADECNRSGTPIVDGKLYGRNADNIFGIMWTLLPANDANRALPNGPSIVARDPRCQAMEK
jgi:hypothetical protein